MYNIFKAELACEFLRKQSNVQDVVFILNQIQRSSAKYLNILALESTFASAPGEILVQTVTAFFCNSR